MKAELKHVTIKSDPIDLKRGYIKALFLEDERWITCIDKCWMIVPGNSKSRQTIRQDLALKEKLSDQIKPDTYRQRKAYYNAWVNAKCCADDCGRYCDECHDIQFESVPHHIAKSFDPDVRRFIEKYQRFWLTSEQDKAIKDLRGDYTHANGREIFNKADGNDIIRDRGRKGNGRSDQREEDSSNPYQRQKESFLWPGPGKVAFEESFEHWGR